MEDPEARHRLGQLLIDARVAMGFRRRAEFMRHLGLSHDRTLSDIENARRTNFDPSTIAFLEQSYGWAPGSIGAVLTGGEPTPRRSPGQVDVTHPNPDVQVEVDQHPVGLGLDDAAADLTPEQIESVRAVIRAMKLPTP